jgi:hypothetical protein
MRCLSQLILGSSPRMTASCVNVSADWYYTTVLKG